MQTFNNPAENEKHKCDTRGLRFDQKGHLAYHIRTHKGEKLIYQYETCQLRFSDNSQLKSHLHTHMGERSLTNVTIADFVFVTHTIEQSHPHAHRRETLHKTKIGIIIPSHFKQCAK